MDILMRVTQGGNVHVWHNHAGPVKVGIYWSLYDLTSSPIL